MKTWKTIAAVVPGPVAIWVGKYFDLFSLTNLVFPRWQTFAQNTAIAVGVFVSIVTWLVAKDWPPQRLRTLTIVCFVLTIAFLGMCWAIWYILGKGMPSATAESWQDIWQGLYIIAMACLVATISFGALLLEEKSGRPAWVIIGVLVLVVIAVAIIAYELIT